MPLNLWIDNPRGSLMVAMYTIANKASKNKHNLFIAPICYAVIVTYKLLTELILNYEIPASTEIGPGLFVDHGYGIVINKHAKIGNNLRIKHNVTIGCQTLPDGSQGPSPRIGDNVDIGAGAIIIGGITIGDNVKIGAGAIVVNDVPSNCVVRCDAGRVYEFKS